MNPKQNVTVCITQHFNVSPVSVFDAWLDPENAGKWLFATPSGQMIRVEIHACVGGSFLFVDRRNGEDIQHIGEYVEIDPPRHLIFAFCVPKFSKESTRVTIDIIPVEQGCELTLTHENVLPDYVSRTEAGWTDILNNLKGLLENGHPLSESNLANRLEAIDQMVMHDQSLGLY